ncbi:unnamed protein product [Spirodela intermedia]|uniref:Uncharacterized protein n=2 Tax=Spirodela intermedia TaxID=51605 RepID=A0A7I8ISR7_SPIIN|nr:unnamed protein product [Spirodela intermedia]CAA6661021.1 unnamed protein product [Spirodela intermedia]CAA7397383.1 unnamed protein product [Spirodela intermedia]
MTCFNLPSIFVPLVGRGKDSII